MIRNAHQKILSALLSLLKPIARAMLRAGVSHAEFNEVAKAAFVNVALDEYGVRGRPTNLSRVAVMTGLNRKEVKSYRDWEPSRVEEVPLGNPLIDLLHLWHTDEEYLDQQGQPIKLKMEGEAPSFQALVKKLGCDLPPGALKTELVRYGVVQQDDSEMLNVLGRTFISGAADERLIDCLDSQIARQAETMEFNADARNSGKTRSNLVVESFVIDPRLMPKLRRMSRKRLLKFAEELDNFLVDYELEGESIQSSASDSIHAGIGLYYFEKK